MTNIEDHRAAAERMLADADEWASQAGELSPEASELSCLARAQIHALFAIHDVLTAADRYATNEERQRKEAEPDPLDEDDHSDRFDYSGDRLVRVGHKHWHTPEYANCLREHNYSLEDWNTPYGPLTFAPDTTRKDS